jgi:tetratricopeptide (TPR) repeat protein
MRQPLAFPGEGFHFAWMKAVLLSGLAFCLVGTIVSPAQAQQAEDTPSNDNPPSADRSPFVIEPPVELLPGPDLPPDQAEPDSEGPDDADGLPAIPPLAPDGGDIDAPDYSRLSSNEERAARLNDMFARLAAAETEDAAGLIAEEIWAVWMDSGSASVNLVLRRGSRAQTMGDDVMARRMFDHVTGLAPDYAEGWARSSRLALEERDFARAASEAVRALTIEPRHFYALWTLGNVLERLGRPEEALDAYREANQLYPALESVSNRVDALELRLDGGVL